MRSNRVVAFFLSVTALFFAVAGHGAETAIVTEGKINVRGKPSFVGEVITQLERGDKVTVLERIVLEKAKESEPTNWAKIKLPQNTPVWVFAPFIKEGKVAATRLNLRAGPGENYSVIGRLGRGDEVKIIRTVTEWMEIEAPEDTYAFIDSGLIRFEGDTNSVPQTANVAATQPAAQLESPTAVTQPSTQPPAQPVTQPETPKVEATTPPPAVSSTEVVQSPAETSAKVLETASQPATDEKPAASAAVPTAETPSPNAATTPEPPAAVAASPAPRTEPLPQVAEPIPPKQDGPLPKRVVRREGIIRATKSIQAPTWFELAHAETGKTINYLFEEKLGEKLGIKLKDYRGQKVVVTGEEAIDPRWPNTPILDMESLDVVP